MNNAIIEQFNEEEEIDRTPFLEKRMGEIQEILEVLSGLNKNKDYRKFVSLILNPRLENNLRRMRYEEEPVKLYRLQGKVSELDSLVELDKLRQAYEQEFQNLKQTIDKGQIKNENNG